MNLLEKIKSKTKIDVDFLIERLKSDLTNVEINDRKKESFVKEKITETIYETMLIILDTTHQPQISERLYTTWIRMSKDYWYLSKNDKKCNKFLEMENQSENDNIKIKSIQIGDTTTTFADTSSQIEINGTTYNTGTIDFNEDILVEKYKKYLYRHRKMRW